MKNWVWEGREKTKRHNDTTNQHNLDGPRTGELSQRGQDHCPAVGVSVCGQEVVMNSDMAI